jgi:hypothetical protein
VVCNTSTILWCIIAPAPEITAYNPKFLANVKSAVHYYSNMTALFIAICFD